MNINIQLEWLTTTVWYNLWMAPPPVLSLYWSIHSSATNSRARKPPLAVPLLWMCVSALPFYYFFSDQWESTLCRERHTNVILVKDTLGSHGIPLRAKLARFFPNTNPLFRSFFLDSPPLSPPQIPVPFSQSLNWATGIPHVRGWFVVWTRGSFRKAGIAKVFFFCFPFFLVLLRRAREPYRLWHYPSLC